MAVNFGPHNADVSSQRTQLDRTSSTSSSKLPAKHVSQFTVDDVSTIEDTSALKEPKPWRSNMTAMRTYLPRTRWMITFAMITTVQALVIIGLQAYILVTILSLHVPPQLGPHEVVDSGEIVDTYEWFQITSDALVSQASVIIFEAIYQILLVLDAGRRKNIVQIVGACMNNISMLAFVAISFGGIRLALVEIHAGAYELESKFHRIIPAYIGVIGLLACVACGTFLMVLVTWLGFREFEWYCRHSAQPASGGPCLHVPLLGQYTDTSLLQTHNCGDFTCSTR